jgi:hypothetical protein
MRELREQMNAALQVQNSTVVAVATPAPTMAIVQTTAQKPVETAEKTKVGSTSLNIYGFVKVMVST